MTTQATDLTSLEALTRDAISELQSTITAHYPTATFELTRSPDDPNSILLFAIADVDDPDEVGDLVVERVVELLVDEGIPVHVIPLRTPERVQAAMEAGRQRASSHRFGALRQLREPA